MTIYSIDGKRENNQQGKKMFTHSKESGKKGQNKMSSPQVMSRGDIERLPIATFEVFVLKTRIFVFSSVEILPKTLLAFLIRI